jgi:aconitate hydratase/homoaconitate hydratase
VAASALAMAVGDPRPLLERVDRDRLDRILERPRTRPALEITLAEPTTQVAAPSAGGVAVATTAAAIGGDGSVGGARTVTGRVQRFGDSVDTDAIIPGEFCHLTDLAALGDKCFHYVRPDFVRQAREGATIVVAGEGWGSGSSREQAVWALQGAGIQLVIAKSYGFIHKRNLVNEALPHLVLQDPAFYEVATEGCELEVDLATGRVREMSSGREFQAETPTPIIQALQAEGGLVPATQRHGQAVFAALSA